MAKEYITINPAKGGTAIAITASQGRVSYANAIHDDPRKRTFIMEKEIMLVNGAKDDVPRAIRATYGKTKTSAALLDNGFRPTFIMEKEIKPGDVIGSMQTNAYHGTTDGTAPTITAACCMGGGQTPMVVEDTATTVHEPKCYGETTGWRIRKLTPRECFRLMGVDDVDIDKIMKPTDAIGVLVNRKPKRTGIPKTQQYKLAGNSIVVDVLYHIFRKMFVEQENENKQQELF